MVVVPSYIKVGTTFQNNYMVCFWVQDNGKGIDSDDQVERFKPFTRFDEAIEGHGLGLSIVQRIAEKLGGQVGADSTLGQGSRFWFTLPACPDEQLINYFSQVKPDVFE